MANQLKVALIESIQSLRAQRWSFRRIARELGIHRETVARYVSGCGKEKPCIPITRWQNFYVGMSYEDAKKYLPEHDLLDRSPGFKNREPERGEDIYAVRVETDDGWYALGFDNSKTLVRISVVED